MGLLMKRHSKAKAKVHRVASRKPARKLHKAARKAKVTLRVSRKVKRPAKSTQVSSAGKAVDDVPTLEQVTITCANCARPFKVFKLKGLSLEGTICQRCSLGEVELPESFG